MLGILWNMLMNISGPNKPVNKKVPVVNIHKQNFKPKDMK